MLYPKDGGSTFMVKFWITPALSILDIRDFTDTPDKPTFLQICLTGVLQLIVKIPNN